MCTDFPLCSAGRGCYQICDSGLPHEEEQVVEPQKGRIHRRHAKRSNWRDRCQRASSVVLNPLTHSPPPSPVTHYANLRFLACYLSFFIVIAYRHVLYSSVKYSYTRNKNAIACFPEFHHPHLISPLLHRCPSLRATRPYMPLTSQHTNNYCKFSLRNLNSLYICTYKIDHVNSSCASLALLSHKRERASCEPPLVGLFDALSGRCSVRQLET